MVTKAKNSAWLRELYDYFAPVRQEATQYDEDEINTDIDAAIKEVRAKCSQVSR